MARSAWIAALVLYAATAAAKEDAATTQAKALFASGTKHFNLAEYTEALNDFKEAYRLKEEPTFLFNIGQCHRMMGNHEEAARFYRNYLRLNPGAGNRAEVEGKIQAEEEVIAAAAAAARKKSDEETELKRKELEIKAAAVRPVYEPWYRDYLGWTIGVAGAALAIGGVALIGYGASIPPPVQMPGGPPLPPDAFARYHDKQNQAFVPGGILLGVGVAALALGIIKLVMYDKPPATAQRPRFRF